MDIEELDGIIEAGGIYPVRGSEDAGIGLCAAGVIIKSDERALHFRIGVCGDGGKGLIVKGEGEADSIDLQTLGSDKDREVEGRARSNERREFTDGDDRGLGLDAPGRCVTVYFSIPSKIAGLRPAVVDGVVFQNTGRRGAYIRRGQLLGANEVGV